MRHLPVPILAAAMLGGCAFNGEPPLIPGVALVNAAGQSVGTVESWETPGGMTFRIIASGLPGGIHGVHVHAVGRCEGPGFESAGSHWNPTNAKHGLNNPAGPHRGDLPNITVAPNGNVRESISLPGASVAALKDADGAAIVIHAAADDLVTDPSGNSGARIACAVL